MFTKVLAALAVVCCLTACGDKVTVNPTTRGDVGESCTRRDDCVSPLACIEGRCLKTGASTANEDGGSQETTSGGKAGESCTKRADCQTGLACISQTCVADMIKTDDAGISSQGDRGESCTASNDCKLTLACVAGRCREKDYDITVQPKQCVSVQCETTEDCCKNFVPGSASTCAMYKQQCDSGIPGGCTLYNRDCACNLVCENDKCGAPNRCSSDTECSFSTPHCVAQKCVQCETKADCFGTNQDCVDNVCRTPVCARDEQCPLFTKCESGGCVKVGCSSDRECYFATKDPRSKCTENKCITPCENDSECTGSFEVCEQRKCVNVGCESDVECRAALFPTQQLGGTLKAVCRPAAAM